MLAKGYEIKRPTKF